MIRSSNSSADMPKWTESRDLRYLYIHIHSSIICNSSEKMEATQESAEEWINKCGINIQWNITQP